MTVAIVSPRPGAPFGELEGLYLKVLEICDGLEAVADSLPNPDRERCEQLACMLTAAYDATNRVEHKLLFPALMASLPANEAGHMIARLSAEHAYDRASIDEVIEVLNTLSHGSEYSWDAAGYMLRAFFMALRRHVACEQDMITFLKSDQGP